MAGYDSEVVRPPAMMKRSVGHGFLVLSQFGSRTTQLDAGVREFDKGVSS